MTTRWWARAGFVLVLLHLGVTPQLRGQASPGEGRPSVPPDVSLDDPPPPAPPAVLNRGEDGGATVRAVRIPEPIRLDGELDEAVYEEVQPVTGFIQSLPDEGAPATEDTEAWILYDDQNVYVSARLHESAPESEWVSNEMRRDTNQLRQNDSFGVVFDTFYDRRNGVMFYTNPLGARADFAMTNEGNPNSDWNPIWDVRVGRFQGGWTVEMEIPFKSLRYRPGRDQVWGLQLRRAIRRKNEWVHLTRVPRSAILGGNGATGVFRVSANGTLVGIEAPEAGAPVEIKPYGISGVTTDRTVNPAIDTDLDADWGLDVKYGITQNLTADLTYNTDFAQVEVDEQQINLTRFNLFFPEKREFFLEGRGIFDFGATGFSPGRRVGNAPILFFSRRIGLVQGAPVPIVAGGRLTGKAGDFDVGALSIQTDSKASVGVPETNFSVLRLKRDVLERSSIGMLYARRSESTLSSGANETYGVDATFSHQDFNAVSFYARTHTPGLTGQEESYRASASYDGDRWGVQAEHLLVGEDFNPEVGFLRRRGFRESFASGRFSPRPESVDWIRQLTLEASLDYIENSAAGFVETRDRAGTFQVELENSDVFSVTFTDSFESIVRSFQVAGVGTVDPGRYEFRDVQVGYNFGLQRRISGNLLFQTGSFFGGDRTTVGFSQGRINVSERLSVEPSLSFNWIDLPAQSFRTDLAVTRINYAFNPRMFLSGLVQYNSAANAFTTNFRFRWEYVPGSELFVVFTEGRQTDAFDPFADLSTRALVVKVNYLLRL